MSSNSVIAPVENCRACLPAASTTPSSVLLGTTQECPYRYSQSLGYWVAREPLRVDERVVQAAKSLL